MDEDLERMERMDEDLENGYQRRTWKEWTRTWKEWKEWTRTWKEWTGHGKKNNLLLIILNMLMEPTLDYLEHVDGVDMPELENVVAHDIVDVHDCTHSSNRAKQKSISILIRIKGLYPRIGILGNMVVVGNLMH
jgi:hypothetical protein